jgi:UDP-N-acetylmuramoyl-tripeptide--D-alanyl-D-alanine ligase
MKIELAKILSIIDGEILNNKKIEGIFISKISTDTRSLQEGECFLALKGENFNGNFFAEEAEKLGASLIFIDEILKDVNFKNFNSVVILVKNCTETYAKIANCYRNSLKAKIIGITGSVGKTTTKNLLGHCLNFASHGYAFASKANLNNHIGVPQNLLMIDENCQYAVIEMGMQTKGEIDFLSKTAEPDIAIINNISPAHLEYFDDLKGIAEAKSEIFHGLKKDGIIILNKNTNHFDFLYEKAKKYSEKIITYSMNFDDKDCDIKIQKYKICDDNSVDIEILIDGAVLNYKLPLGVVSLIENSLAVLAVFKSLKLNSQIASEALENFSIENLKGRGQILKKEYKGKKLIIIDETYNAGVDAMKTALKNLVSLPFANEKIGRRVAILGEMRELGEKSKEIHMELIDFLNDVNFVITTGDESMKSLNDLIPKEKNGGHFKNVEEILEKLEFLLEDGDLILIKGARHRNRLDKILDEMNLKN